MKVCVETSFEAAHYIPNHPKCGGDKQRGLCHGHTYQTKVVIEGRVGENGMVVDFGEVKKVLRQFDHCFINYVAKKKDIEELRIPTAENLARYFAEKIRELGSFDLVKVTVWETADCSVTAQVVGVKQ